MPRDLSVVHPRSFCPACEKTIAWYDNIPLLSYALLGGRCRYCRAPIPLRYPLVELLTGVLSAVNVLAWGATGAALKFSVFGAIMIGLLFADLEERILPDELTLGGTLAGLVFAWFVPVEDIAAHLLYWMAGVQPSVRWLSVSEAALAAVLPPLFLWFGGWLFEKVRHKEGLGLGDVKMMMMIGAFLGLRASLLTLVAGSVLGSVIGYAYILITRKDAGSYELPFGTFLALAGIVVSLAGRQIIGWYGSFY